MPTADAHKRFTAGGDIEAEALLRRVLAEIGDALAGTGLCVVLGGSYGRGDGGVRSDRENGILYNDLDFFVFSRQKVAGAEVILNGIAEKYEHELKVDVDFSAIMSVQDMKKNVPRLMMQELKRGYHLVCGEDLPAVFLQELPASALPFSEACRLLLNRGMGLLLAGEQLSDGSEISDFTLRNIYKAILGAGDAMLIAGGSYRWQLAERLQTVEQSSMPDKWKTLYREAVDFKRTPHRTQKPDMKAFWSNARDFFRWAVSCCAGEEGNLHNGIFRRCRQCGELSFKNFVKYCIRTRSLPLAAWSRHNMTAVAVMVPEVYLALQNMPEKLDRQSKLYRNWQIFN